MTTMNPEDLNLDVIAEKLTAMTAQEFLNLGADGLAYIKNIGPNENGQDLYALFSADGGHIATGQDVEKLKIIATSQTFLPLSVQ
jgi:hypothetical protein